MTIEGTRMEYATQPAVMIDGMPMKPHFSEIRAPGVKLFDPPDLRLADLTATPQIGATESGVAIELTLTPEVVGLLEYGRKIGVEMQPVRWDGSVASGRKITVTDVAAKKPPPAAGVRFMQKLAAVRGQGQGLTPDQRRAELNKYVTGLR